MPPGGGGGGGEQGFTEQDHPPATAHIDNDAPSHLPPAMSGLPVIVPVASEKKQQKQEQKREPQPAARLPDDVLLNILSRVPYASLCRFKCVSKPWRALCSDPDVRRRSPQTLSGFFHDDGRCRLRFRNLSGTGPPLVDPALPFLFDVYGGFAVLQCCGGLLLLKCLESRHCQDDYDYVVCNPATEELAVLPPMELPDPDGDGDDAVVVVDFDEYDVILGFDAAAPSCFAVFVPLRNFFRKFTQVAIFSSETGDWNFVQSGWYYRTIFVGNSQCVVLNGTMHLTTHRSSVVTVDMEWKDWREIDLPAGISGKYYHASIGQSQGRLHAWQVDNPDDCKLSVWVLEDYVSGHWTLKHSVNLLELFGRDCYKADETYAMFAIHPDRNVVFITDGEEMTVSYDMDNRKVHVMSTSKKFLDGMPYIPCFVEWSSGVTESQFSFIVPS